MNIEMKYRWERGGGGLIDTTFAYQFFNEVEM